MVLYNTRFCDQGLPELVKEQTLDTPVERITCADQIYQVCTGALGLQFHTEEYLYVIAINSYGDILGCFEVSHGTVNASVSSPREIFLKLLLLGAVAFFMAHNHPSQHSKPSQEDISVTKRIKEVGDILGIQLLEHIIVGKDSYTALFRDEYMC